MCWWLYLIYTKGGLLDDQLKRSNLRNNFLYPVRALLRRTQRLVAIMTSAVVESALIVIVSGYCFMNNSTPKFGCMISVLTDICKSCRYVWISILRSVNYDRFKNEPRKNEREDYPSYTMPKIKLIHAQPQKFDLENLSPVPDPNKTVSHKSNNMCRSADLTDSCQDQKQYKRCEEIALFVHFKSHQKHSFPRSPASTHNTILDMRRSY